MSRPQLILKQSTGWFAAGWQFAQALEELSDPAFKLYAWVCLRADRHTGQVRSNASALASALEKPEHWVESAVRDHWWNSAFACGGTPMCWRSPIDTGL